MSSNSGAEHPLAGIRVVEMGQLIAGPFCGQLLGDMGADVIKLEAPGAGDPMRLWGKANADGDHLHWRVIGRNKRSMTLDLRQPEGQDVARELISGADVLVENFRPGTLERWNLDPARLRQSNPGLVVVRVSGFGQTGPYAARAGYGSIGEAMGGLRYISGEPDRPPARIGVSIGDSLAGVFAALGALSALQARQRNGRGQVVDASIYESVLAIMESMVTEWSEARFQRERSGPILPGVAPSNLYPTADSQDVLIAANQNTVFARLAQAMEMPELVESRGFATHEDRGTRQAELDAIISDWTRRFAASDLLDLLNQSGVPAGLVYRAENMMDDPQFVARESITRAADRLGREYAMQNVAPRLSDTPGKVRWPGPDLGQHTTEILTGMGIDESRQRQLRDRGII